MTWEKDGHRYFSRPPPSFGPRKKDVHFWCRLTWVLLGSPFPLARNFKSHQRHVSARQFDKKLFPRSLDMQHRQTGERQRIYRRRMKDIEGKGRDRYDRKKREDRRRRKSKGTKVHSGKYSGIVNYAMQIRASASRCISNPATASLRFASGFAAVIFIIWNLQCLVSIVQATCLGMQRQTFEKE